MVTDQNKEVDKLDKGSKRLLIWGIVLILFSIIVVAFLPLAVTECTWFGLDVSTPNEIGDTIGGIMGPAVGIMGVSLTFLAFWAQYAANKEQRRQFDDTLATQEADKKFQQFESQFYEMLRLHKENVNEIEFTFETWDINKNAYNYITARKRDAFLHMNAFFKRILSHIPFDNVHFPREEFTIAYEIFFWGFTEESLNKLDSVAQRQLSPETTDVDDKEQSQWLGRLHGHTGYASILGHYYRHLFATVQFVVESEVVKNYQNKMKYLKILRSQLSNYEQIMLLYNWLSEDYGRAWEEDGGNGNCFFTGYKMIHNLWVNELFQNQFIVDQVNILIDKYNANKKDTPLFEFQGSDFTKKWILK